MPIPRRYEIFEIKKMRPVVIVSLNEMNRYLDTLVVCPLTSILHTQWRSRVQVKCAGKRAEVAVDQIRTISKLRLRNKIGKLARDEAYQIRKCITEMYGEV